jgi:hypothetical protein
MLAVREFRALRNEIAVYECTCFEDLRLFSYQIIARIRQLSKTYEGKDDFFKLYIYRAILPNLEMIKQVMIDTEVQEEIIEFKSRTLKYHFQFIIDSCIYAIMVNYRTKKEEHE